MVDVHVHTREPGVTHKEDIITTTQQAAAGGVTTIFGMPNLIPPTNSVETLQEVFDLYEQKSIVDYNHNPAATQADELVPMATMGINAFKIYMVVDTGRTYPHPAGTGMHGHGDLLRMMDIIKTTGKRFIIHPHDQSLMDYIEGEYLARGRTRRRATRRHTPRGTASSGTPPSRSCCDWPRRPGARCTSRTCRPSAQSMRCAARRPGASTSRARSTTGCRSSPPGRTSSVSGRTRCRTGSRTRAARRCGRDCGTGP